jgi:hypothetical protein
MLRSRMRVALTLLSLSAAAILAGFSSGPAGNDMASAHGLCKNVRGGEVISAHRLSCRKARRIAAGWVRGYERDGERNRRVLKFKCTQSDDAYEGSTIRCRRNGRSVRFYQAV